MFIYPLLKTEKEKEITTELRKGGGEGEGKKWETKITESKKTVVLFMG